MKRIILFSLVIAVFVGGCGLAMDKESPTKSSSPIIYSTATSSTDIPLPSPTPSPLPTETSIPIHPTGEVVYHPADDLIAYNWYSYVPPNLDPDQIHFIWVTGMHGNFITDDYEQITKFSMPNEFLMHDANEHGYIALIPVIPRPGTYHYMYPVAFSSHVFYDDTPPLLQRPDVKLNLMIDRLTSDLRSDGYKISDKIMISGFSAGGMFAQRYTLLNPNRVQAVAAGQCGGALTFPLSSIDSYEMHWPLGIGDYESLAGYKFDEEAYKKVFQFYFICDLDFNKSNEDIPNYERGSSDLIFINKNFGNIDPVRLSNQVKYLRNQGFSNIVFKAYTCDGHNFTKLMQQDAFSFFKDHNNLLEENTINLDKYQEYIEALPTREPTPSSVTGIVIDGSDNDWVSVTPYVDDIGDSELASGADISRVYFTEDAHYVDVLISGNPSITTQNTYIQVQFSTESYEVPDMIYCLVINPPSGAVYGGYCGENLENRKQVTHSWKQNIEIQVPKSLFSPMSFKSIYLVRVIVQQSGQTAVVDELVIP